MRKIVVSLVSVLFILLSTFAFATIPDFAPPANALLQFTSGGHVLGFSPNKVYMAGMGHALTEEFINSNTVIPKHLSSDKVVYENLWKGISLTYEAKKTGIAESIYTVTQGADVKNIRIRYNAEVTIQKNGTITFNHPSSQGSYAMSAPVAWQEREGTKIPVQIAYTRLTDNTIGFSVAVYDKNLPLIIDPVYQWHTFYGSAGEDSGKSIAVDKSGNVYVVGFSEATWGSPLNPYSDSRDIVVMKLDSSGAFQWHAFYGSSQSDDGYGIAVGANGNIYITGRSYATWGSPLNAHSGGSDIMVLKLNSSGAYQWHTFYGSSSSDCGQGIALDESENIYITGYSYATWGSPLNAHSGGSDIMVLKLNSSGAYQWHTFYGSGGADFGSAIAMDGNGNVYVTGDSPASWGLPLNPYAGFKDIVVLKLNNSGNYQWHTFYGSSVENDYGNGIAADASGNVYITGYSYATWGVPLNPYSGDADMLILKLNSSGAYQWHTFYGASGSDVGKGISVDESGNIYVAGYSSATWGTPLNPYSGAEDIVVLELDSSGAYQWHTFYGSSDANDGGQGIAFDGRGGIYVTAYGAGVWGFPLNAHSGGGDIVVLKLAETVSPVEGTIGTKVTINGTGFGTKKGKVLINGIATKIAKSGWGPGQINCTINKPPLPIDVAHPVSVLVNKVPTSIDGTFTLRLPALDDLVTTSGAYPDPIKVTGKFFSTKKGKVYLYEPVTEKKKKLKVTSWKMNESNGMSELTFVVAKPSKNFPAGAYQLKISNKVGQATTAPEFTVLAPAP